MVYALKLLYNEDSGRYVYYYIDASGKEWGVFIRKYKDEYYELRTAYRADCGPPFECIDENGIRHEYSNILGKWLCEGFKLISMW